jgi:exodeoxyribonuclease-5
MNWSPQQEKALLAVNEWLKAPSDPVFYLAGYAGTGKTTMARHFAEGIDGRVEFAAYTGKAAHMMRKMGCFGASTIHNLIYHPTNDVDGKLRFVLNPDSRLRGAALLIIDECSMVSEEIGKDLMSFNVPILVLGDPAQLPPVNGDGFFTADPPDIMLTEIHRQALDNPIIQLATKVREQGILEYGDYGESRVVTSWEFRHELKDRISDGTQILVGKNATRRRANQARRKKLLDPKDPIVTMERLVCLRNNHNLGLLNGSIWKVARVRNLDMWPTYVVVDLINEDDGQCLNDIAIHGKPFLGEKLRFYEHQMAESFDYGYVLTTHKAQGSQWENVVVVDESFCFPDNRHRWLYTAITRASERVMVVT